MDTIGETMRRERVRQGLDLQTVSQNTKIGTRMLKAMEAGDFAKLPGGVFTRSFVRQYAIALGLDPVYVEAELSQMQAQADDKNRPPERTMERSRSLFAESMVESKSIWSSLVWVAVAILVCGGVYFIMEQRKAEPPVTVERAEPKTTAPVPQEVKQEAAQEPKPVADAAQPVAPPPIGTGSLQVILSASEQSWVSISVDGKVQFSGILHANDKREVHADQRVKVIAGNAGGIDISLNGKTIEALGPKGQARTVELTRAGAQVVSRTPKPAPLL